MYRAIQGVVKGVDTITAEGTMEYPKTREEWLALRHKHISSTEVAALFGGAVAGGAYFYSKWRTKKSQDASTVLLSSSTPPEAKSEATSLLSHDSEQMAKSGNQSEQ